MRSTMWLDVYELFSELTKSEQMALFSAMKQDLFPELPDIVGCIGVEINSNNCDIKHTVVSPEERGNGIGSKMIKFLCENYALTTITAETDKDVVVFYRKFGFKITSLGEKYPGVERFLCEYRKNQAPK